VLVFAHDLVITEDAASLLAGGGLVFASAVAYAIYLVSNGGIIERIGPVRFTAYGMSVSALIAVGQFLFSRPLSVLDAPASVYWMAFGMASISTVLPVWMTNEGIRRIGAGRVAMIGTSGPIMTIGLGAVFLGEAITTFQLFGAALVIAGVIVVTFSRSPRRA